MIQEKDFLYRVPVKNALVTTPGQQVRNPEILVDVEGGEFMHGNILDANSTNKLINQSVKDAVDNKIVESGYVTQDLLEAETSARTKGDEDLSSKIQAEQTRAEGKEKEISDKLAIVDGDSNTEGSFRKAIADVVAAAPEDLDTLKEIADKLAGNDDLHTALNQAITEKADASALLNEVTRATGAESGLQAAIATKADATALSNYVLTTALNKQVDTLNAAISAKQDAGNYIPFDPSVTNAYQINKKLIIKTLNGTSTFGQSDGVKIQQGDTNYVTIDYYTISNKNKDFSFLLSPAGITQVAANYKFNVDSSNGVKLSVDGNNAYSKMDINGLDVKASDHYYTKCGSMTGLDIKKGDTQTILNPEQLLIKSDDGKQVILTPEQLLIKSGDHELNYSFNKLSVKYGDRYVELGPFTNQTIGGLGIHEGSNGNLWIYPDHITIDRCPSGENIRSKITINGDGITTDNGSILFASHRISGCDIQLFGNGVSGLLSENIKHIYASKQDKITANTIDVTGIETADISKLRTIVSNLLDALTLSGLIKQNAEL